MTASAASPAASQAGLLAASQAAAIHPIRTDGRAAGALSWSDLMAHRGDLVRFARRRLHDPALAEDLVHDVFEAVMSGRARFEGRAALRSWLTAILKHKIVDLVRQRARLASLDEADDGEPGEGVAAVECPRPRPDEIAEQRQLLVRTLARIEALPAALRDVMELRVLQDQPADAVCRRLAISETNLFVRMHRARRQLTS